MSPDEREATATTDEQHAGELAERTRRRGALDAAKLLQAEDDRTVVNVLRKLNPATALHILDQFSAVRRRALVAAAPAALAARWELNHSYPDNSVGRLMETPKGVFPPEMTVAEAAQQVRELVKTTFVTYGYVTDPAGRLLGIITMRDLLVAEPAARLRDVMLANPFSLSPEMPLLEAMKQVVVRHFPVYPVCEQDGRLVGLVRGESMFEEQAFEISAQAGRMVGVDKEERLSTPWQRSLRFRHPWLQLNLLTAFVAAAVVGFFQDTIDRIVVLAVFLPVLAGQSGNTGCQALAVALRGMTLGELRPGKERALVMKEALLGLFNGASEDQQFNLLIVRTKLSCFTY